MSRVYVFALTGGIVPAFEWQGRRVECVSVGRLTAAIERIDRRLPVAETALRAQHEIVMQLAASVDAILPVRFGALIEEAELEQLIATRGEILARALDVVRGRIQMTVRIRERVDQQAPAAARAASAAPSGTAYLEARRAAAGGCPSTEAAAVDALVGNLAAASLHDRSRDRNITSVYHLIARDAVDDYRRALTALPSSRLVVSGPWPPFAFAPDLWP
jgi:hypothetical protein